MVENASNSRPRLTTPLRASSTNAADTSLLKSNARSWGRNTTFVQYLPQDEAIAAGHSISNAGLDSDESQMAVDILNDELSWLLKLGPRDFWREVARNESLSEALDSYLLFRSRWYDLPHNGPTGVVAGVIVGEDELSRRVFMTFYRMSSNKDPDSKTRDSLSSKEHADLLRNKKLLDIPRLLDICSIYADDNKELTRVLVSNSIRVQQISAASLSDTCHHFLQIVNTMHLRCSSTIEALSGYGGLENKGHFEKDLLEVMDFINDAVMSLDAFVDVYKLASLYFSLPLENSEGHCGVLSMLRRLHDSLLPSLHHGLAHISSLSNYSHSLRLLSIRIVNFGWKLLESCYLSDDIVEDVTLEKTAKLLPVEINDPVVRGDILVQTLRDISEEGYNQNETKEYGTFLQNIETNFYLLSRIDSLRSNGWIFLHDEAFLVSCPKEGEITDQQLVLAKMTSGSSIDKDGFVFHRLTTLKNHKYVLSPIIEEVAEQSSFLDSEKGVPHAILMDIGMPDISDNFNDDTVLDTPTDGSGNSSKARSSQIDEVVFNNPPSSHTSILEEADNPNSSDVSICKEIFDKRIVEDSQEIDTSMNLCCDVNDPSFSLGEKHKDNSLTAHSDNFLETYIVEDSQEEMEQIQVMRQSISADQKFTDGVRDNPDICMVDEDKDSQKVEVNEGPLHSSQENGKSDHKHKQSLISSSKDGIGICNVVSLDDEDDLQIFSDDTISKRQKLEHTKIQRIQRRSTRTPGMK